MHCALDLQSDWVLDFWLLTRFHFFSVFRTRKAGDQGVGVRLTGVQSSSAVPYASVRWTDHNNRSHSWSGEVASSDRSQIIAQIRSQTGAKQVIVQSVKG